MTSSKSRSGESRNGTPAPPRTRIAEQSLGPYLALFIVLCLTLGACSDDTPSEPADTVPPEPITDLEVETITRTRATVSWTAPGDDGDRGQAAKYVIRYAEIELTSANFDTTGQIAGEPEPQQSGDSETFTVSGLDTDTLYWIAIRSEDEAGNRSGLSNVVEAETPSTDLLPPDAITALGFSRLLSTEITLAWFAPGDDADRGTAAGYQIRQSQTPISDGNWDTVGKIVGEPIPNPAGSFESFTVSGLEPLQRYYFAIKTVDDAENWSPLSNVLEVDTPTEDPTAPGTVTDLSVELISLYSARLSWTAPGGDGASGRAHVYDLRLALDSDSLFTFWDSTRQIPLDPPEIAGTPTSHVLGGLEPRTSYFFGLKSADEAGNESELSNLAFLTTSDSVCVIKADGTGDFATIREALELGAGCEIQLADGVFKGVENTVWPDTPLLALSSQRGNPSACIIDFEGKGGRLSPTVSLDGIGFRNGVDVVLSSSDDRGQVLSATGCRFESMSLTTTGQFLEGPAANFRNCDFAECIGSPFLDVAAIDLEDCTFFENDGRITVGYEILVDGCHFERNSVPTGALFRSFQDLTFGTAFEIRDSRFLDNSALIAEPQNGTVRVLDCLFTGSSGGIIRLPGTSGVEIERCTFTENEGEFGTCILAENAFARIDIDRSIFAGNRAGPIFSGANEAILTIRCTDIFGNDAGDWTGALAPHLEIEGNLALDPNFCDRISGNFTLRADSPCAEANQPACGQIGARGVGCR